MDDEVSIATDNKTRKNNCFIDSRYLSETTAYHSQPAIFASNAILNKYGLHCERVIP